LLPEPEQQDWLGSLTLRRYTSLTITDMNDLREELHQIREQGYSVDPGQYSDFWRSVAVPVLGAGQKPVAAMTCGGLPEKMTIEHQGWMQQEMSVAADELSHQLA
jgi:DNA-binding IclR family transcriptional regulator